jgi:hypothetical protein
MIGTLVPVVVRSFFIAHLMCFAVTFVVNSQIVLRQADVIILVLKNVYYVGMCWVLAELVFCGSF